MQRDSNNPTDLVIGKWTAPVNGAANYKVELMDDNEDIVKSNETTETTLDFSSLTPGETYKAVVTPYNNAGEAGERTTTGLIGTGA